MCDKFDSSPNLMLGVWVSPVCWSHLFTALEVLWRYWLIADSNLLYSSSYHYDLALPYSTTWHPVSPDINNRNSLQEIQCQDNHGGCLAMMEPGQYWIVNGDGKD